MNIKELREKKNMTQEELSSQTGIPRARLSKWEAGKAKPKAEDLRTLENFFSVREEKDHEEKGTEQPETHNTTMQAILNLTYSSRKTADGIDKMAEGIDKIADANLINARSMQTMVLILAANLGVGTEALKGLSHEDLQRGDVPVEAFLGGTPLWEPGTAVPHKKKNEHR